MQEANPMKDTARSNRPLQRVLARCSICYRRRKLTEHGKLSQGWLRLCQPCEDKVSWVFCGTPPLDDTRSRNLNSPHAAR